MSNGYNHNFIYPNFLLYNTPDTLDELSKNKNKNVFKQRRNPYNTENVFSIIYRRSPNISPISFKKVKHHDIFQLDNYYKEGVDELCES